MRKSFRASPRAGAQGMFLGEGSEPELYGDTSARVREKRLVSRGEAVPETALP